MTRPRRCNTRHRETRDGGYRCPACVAAGRKVTALEARAEVEMLRAAMEMIRAMRPTGSIIVNRHFRRAVEIAQAALAKEET